MATFKVGDKVEFFRSGVWQPATVVAVVPKAVPSYDVQTHPMFEPIRCANKSVRAPKVLS